MFDETIKCRKQNRNKEKYGKTSRDSLEEMYPFQGQIAQPHCAVECTSATKNEQFNKKKKHIYRTNIRIHGNGKNENKKAHKLLKES